VTHDVLLFLTTFFASAVEAVEALTIVLAVGVVRGWRSTMIGVGAATAVLAVIVAALGPALQGAAFARERRAAEGAGVEERAGIDWYSFTVAFKGVLLEGLEVVFIVVTFGSTQGNLGLAAAAAAAALVLVVVVGAVVRGPLERVPENTLKYAVGLLLTSFGVFWGGEGAGVDWPGSDLAIFGIVAFMALVSFALTRSLSRRRTALKPAESRA